MTKTSTVALPALLTGLTAGALGEGAVLPAAGGTTYVAEKGRARDRRRPRRQPNKCLRKTRTGGTVVFEMSRNFSKPSAAPIGADKLALRTRRSGVQGVAVTSPLRAAKQKTARNGHVSYWKRSFRSQICALGPGSESGGRATTAPSSRRRP